MARSRWLVLVVFIVGTALRVSLALVNREANDDHMTVVRMIRTTGQLPTKADCWECFQPKLFHRTAAAALDMAHVPPGIAEIKIIQLMNRCSGVRFWYLRGDSFVS